MISPLVGTAFLAFLGHLLYFLVDQRNGSWKEGTRERSPWIRKTVFHCKIPVDQHLCPCARCYVTNTVFQLFVEENISL